MCCLDIRCRAHIVVKLKKWFCGFLDIYEVEVGSRALRICEYSTRCKNSMASVFGGKMVEQNLAKEL